eukprot:6174827-Pleurochrysis_carterae.AAC.3
MPPLVCGAGGLDFAFLPVSWSTLQVSALTPATKGLCTAESSQCAQAIIPMIPTSDCVHFWTPQGEEHAQMSLEGTGNCMQIVWDKVRSPSFLRAMRRHRNVSLCRV